MTAPRPGECVLNRLNFYCHQENAPVAVLIAAVLSFRAISGHSDQRIKVIWAQESRHNKQA